MSADKVLMKEFKELEKEKWLRIELENENIRNWIVGLYVLNPSSLYYGGYFKAKMTFPSNYPYSPPSFRFLKPLLHPNVYKDGKLCISILHPPGEDEMSGELASERWSPAQRVESVLISILSLLDDAEISSPANVEASVKMRNEPELYKQKIRELVAESQKDMPEDFVIPNAEDVGRAPQKDKNLDEDDFWIDSDGESFGGDDDDFGDGSGEDQEFDDEDGEQEEEEDEEDDKKTTKK
ncbi:hypothetical protein BJ508DRAFT_171314 [Ascobolus immersus RN42]|uniref:Ubiquitin-conjugating enzyme E2 2 n=1 Tax=Ascobolus immersus RN42 TaxID=1160509 RepID=A0A3N4I6F5_ASCIM|nr:hypothetical protein BJ508DRAFT_171314 [Ascobolus immersus RN42]